VKRYLLRFLLVLAIFNTGCHLVHVEKRRYTKGWYIQQRSAVGGVQKSGIESTEVATVSEGVSKPLMQEHTEIIVQETKVYIVTNSLPEVLSTSEEVNVSESQIASKDQSNKPVKPRRTQVSTGFNGGNAARFSGVSAGLMTGLGFSAGLLLLVLLRFQSIRRWAGQNPKAAFWAVAVLRHLIKMGGLALGGALLMQGLKIPSEAFAIAAGVSGVMMLVNMKEVRTKLNSRKAAPILWISNVTALAFAGQFLMEGGLLPTPAGEMSETGKALITILVFLVVLALLYGLLALSCSIACNGYSAAAMAVLFGGGYLLIMAGLLIGWKLWNPKSAIPAEEGEERERHLTRRKKRFRNAFIIPAIIMGAFCSFLLIMSFIS
jgi:hypothetical protein